MEVSNISKQIGDFLIREGRTIAIAESCTGGLVAASITDIPGSSEYFGYGIVSYSNEAKIGLLGVRKQTLKKYGAVSRETALEMAEGVRKISSANFGLSITGIAGPGGATANKPVGLVYLGFSSNDNNGYSKLNLEGNRLEIRRKSILSALKFLLQQIDGNSKRE